MGNAFLNRVETQQEEAAFLTLQMAVTKMSRESFIPKSPPNERTFLLKDCTTLKEMDPETDDIQNHNMLSEYGCRLEHLNCFCVRPEN